jgi:hypothetical protein
MTTVASGRAARPAPGPCLTAAPSAGPVITVLFVVAIALFMIGLVAL